MKAGIWGAGFIARSHVQALRANGIEIAAVVSRTAEKTKAFAREYGIPVWSTDPSVFLDPEIDAVHVCTPPGLHFEMLTFLLEHEKNVLCEKPLCLSDEEARSLADLARDKGLICGTNYNVRFHMACQKAKSLVSSGDFGRILLIHGSYLQEFHAFPVPYDWRYDEEKAGRMRAVTEIGSHWLDLAQYISGKKIVAVSANFGKFYPTRTLRDGLMYPSDESGPADGRDNIRVDSEDAASINLRFTDGAIGSVLLSELSQGRINRLSLEITGEKKNLWWNSEDNNLLMTAVKDGGVQTEVFGFGNGFDDTFKDLTAGFYADVKRGSVSEDPAYATFSDGKNIVELCNAVLESDANDGAWRTVPYEN